MLQFFESPPTSISFYKLLSKMLYNLFSIFGAGIIQNILLYPDSYMPIHAACFRIDIYRYPIASIIYD